MWAAAACGVQVGAAMAASRLVVADVPPITFAMLRYGVAALLLWPLVVWMGRPAKSGHPNPSMARTEAQAARDLPWRQVAWLAIGQFAAVIAFLNHGLRHIDSASAALIFNLFPLIAMAVAVALGHERWQLSRVLGLGVALAGVAVCVGPEIRTGSPGYLLGAGLVFLAATAGAVSSVLSRPVLQGVSPLGFAVRAFVAATAFLATLALAVEQPMTALLRLQATQLWVIAGIGASSAGAYWLWLYALKHESASRVTVFLALSPLAAAFCGAWWLGEPLALSLFVSVALIACGLALSTR